MIPRIRRSDCGSIIFYDIWRNFPAEDFINGQATFHILEDLAQAEIDTDQIKNYRWIFDLKPEGVSSQGMIAVFDFFHSKGLDADQFRVAFSCVEDISKVPYPAISLPDRLIYNGNWWMHLEHYKIDWANLPMTHKLTCLMRRPSVSRGTLAKRLLAKFDVNDLVMTFGTSGSDSTEDIRRMIWPHPYPMIVDRPMVDQVFQHRIDHDFFYRASVNLIVESSSQTDPNVWRSIFITEKTFKAMAWHQFPVWYAVPGLVSEVRKMGFDVFDDLFDDHAYDSTQDPWVRMTQVVLLAKRFCDQDIVAMRQQHWSRLAKNADLIREIHTTAISRHTEALERLIYGT